jgi:carbamoyltransferase
VTAAGGLRIICNNEEERFSGRKHASTYPSASLEALTKIMKDLGIGPEQIVAWLATYDYPLFVATSFRSLLEEFPASLGLVLQDHRPTFDRSQFKEGICAPARLGRLFGFDNAMPIIGMSHHNNHAWFSYLGLAVRPRSTAGDDRRRRRFGRFRLDLALFERERKHADDSQKWQHF